MNVVTVPDNRLRVKCKPVKKITPELVKITKEMVALTKTFVDPEGVGLAATQIGQDHQYFVIRIEGENFQTYFNPQIVKYSKATKQYFEGCLSIPEYWGEVNRSVWVDVTYLDTKGQKHEERLKGLMAWIFQHEFDHLQGTLYVDHVLQQKGRFFKVSGKDRAGDDIFEEIKLTA